MRYPVFLALALSCALAAGQSAAPPDPKLPVVPRVQVPPSPARPKLLDASSKKIVAAPDFGGYGTPVCDEDGNAYYHVGTAASYSDSTAFRLSADEDQHQVFKLPPDAVDGSMFGAFNVTPSGEVWIVAFNRKDEVVAYGFDEDGEVTSRVHFQTPDFFQPNLVAPFETDFFLLKGFFAKAAGTDLAGKNYAAVFGPSGKLVRQLTDEEAKTTKESRKNKLPEGAAAVGSDGNAYLLESNEVLVVSQSGEMLRKLRFEKPDQEARASNLFVSGGLVAIVMFKTNRSAIDTTLLVLDANTGETYGYYEPSQELGNNPICFSRSQGFKFMRRDKDGKIELQMALLR